MFSLCFLSRPHNTHLEMYGDSLSEHVKVLDIMQNRRTQTMVLFSETDWNVFERRVLMCGEIGKYRAQIHGEKIRKLANF